MNLSKIHHIAIIVSDYEVAKDFYINKMTFFHDPDGLPLELHE
ncbi:hypothetical protein [Agathobacter rectalis]|nr:hypothetical protein [Agathobacter rectalis]